MPEINLELPVLQHAESQLLYTEGLKWDAIRLQHLLSLPRPTLIADLQTILRDTKERSEYFETLPETDEIVGDAALNAIMLLGEIKAHETLPLILDWLTAPMDFLDFWIGDHITETLWEPLYKLLPDHTGAVEAFLTNIQAYEFARGAVVDALGQLVMHQPEQRTYVLSIFQHIFEYYLQLLDKGFDEETFLGLAIHQAEDIEAIELWPVIETLFDAGRVDEFAAGTKAEALKEMQQPSKPGYYFKEILPVQERYQKITTTWDGYINKEGMLPYNTEDGWADWEEDEQSSTVIRTQPKVGRNDPCPCGSGKKYKKCCLSKLEA